MIKCVPRWWIENYLTGVSRELAPGLDIGIICIQGLRDNYLLWSWWTAGAKSVSWF